METIRINYKEYIAFTDKAAAEAYVAELDNSIYHLAHGEAGRPIYKVRKFRNIPFYGIYATYNYFYGTCNPRKNGFLEA